MDNLVYIYLLQRHQQNKAQDFEVLFLNEQGKPVVQKWVSFVEHKDNPQFIARCATQEVHMLQGPDYIIFDLDEETREDDLQRLLAYLNDRSITYELYRSGGVRDSPHVHIYCPELPDLSKEKREKKRLFLFQKFNADLMFKIDRHMVAAPGTIRFKTGRRKQLIERKVYEK